VGVQPIQQNMRKGLLILMFILAAAFGIYVGAVLRPSLPWHAASGTTTVSFTATATVTPIVTFAATTEEAVVEGDFTLPIVGAKGLTGSNLTLSSFRGNVIVLEFMRPSCPFSQKAAPFMEKLYEQYAKKGVVFIAIAGRWDSSPAAVAEFIQRYNSSLTYVYDSTGEVFQMYAVKAVPTLFVLSKSGAVSSSYLGAPSYDIIAKAIDEQVG
jgi:thiol-disulfide isomerase/thioredoxin